MAPYRFSFETDEQYALRVQSEPLTLSIEGALRPYAPGNAEVKIVSPPMHHSSKTLVLPWWAVSIVLMLSLIAAFRSHQKKLMLDHVSSTVPLGRTIHNYQRHWSWAQKHHASPLATTREAQTSAGRTTTGRQRSGSRKTSILQTRRLPPGFELKALP